jgi:hypothetical protein
VTLSGNKELPLGLMNYDAESNKLRVNSNDVSYEGFFELVQTGKALFFKSPDSVLQTSFFLEIRCVAR